MKVLLQRLVDGWYYAGPHHWVANASSALDFEVAARAVSFVTQARIEGVQIVLRFSGDHPAGKIALRARAEGFTRTDLLMVVASTAILLLAVWSSRANVYLSDSRLICINNVRQIMAALNVYATDNREYLPHPSWGNIGSAGIDCWAYAERNNGRLPDGPATVPDLGGRPDRRPQLPFRQLGQLWPYLRRDSVYDCPDDYVKSNPRSGLYIGRSMKVTSYSMNGAAISFGQLPLGSTHRRTSFNQEAILLWEPHEGVPFTFNDAANQPTEGFTTRHGSAMGLFRSSLASTETSGGGNVGRIDGGAEYMTKIDLDKLAAGRGPNALWCDPNSPTGGR